MEALTAHSTIVLAIIACGMPLLTYVVLSLFKFSGKSASALAVASLSVSFLIALLIFFKSWNNEVTHFQTAWFTVGNFHMDAGILINNLSVLMFVLVSFIALLVHLYSLSYMKDDPNLSRYWAYLGLFCFSMLALVIADNLLLIYMFWELVGFSSYLLIGFWFTKEAAAQAAKKAFIINRIGDLGFLCGLFILFAQFGTFDLQKLFADGGLIAAFFLENGQWVSANGSMPEIWLSIAGLAFLLGAMAKSAQFPFHTWLPDAMEGPTSVSSLIHAATMVAAGVFLLGRIHPLFNQEILNLMVIIGALTAFMAATIALTQNDIKRILAFSTVSQLGFMILAMGIGAIGESMLHLAAHAFFKCLLFLGAGAVIQQLHRHGTTAHDHQDIRFMGGLRKQMPITFVVMLIGALALAGIPFSSGFLSKDAILVAAFDWGRQQSGVLAFMPYLMVISSLLTAFYIFRLVFKVFLGDALNPTINDASSLMKFVMIVLAAGSTFLLFSINPFSFESAWIMKGIESASRTTSSLIHTIVPLAVSVLSLLSILLAYQIYVKGRRFKLQENNWLFRFSLREWYLNELNNSLIVSPVQKLSVLSRSFDRFVLDGLVNGSAKFVQVIASISAWIDRYIIDGIVNLSGNLSIGIGNFGRSFQTGKVQQYLLTMLAVLSLTYIITYLL